MGQRGRITPIRKNNKDSCHSSIREIRDIFGELRKSCHLNHSSAASSPDHTICGVDGFT